MNRIPAIGRFVRITNMARVDCIGKVVRHQGNGAALVRVENWQADGYYREFAAFPESLEYSTKAEAVAAAKNR